MDKKFGALALTTGLLFAIAAETASAAAATEVSMAMKWEDLQMSVTGGSFEAPASLIPASVTYPPTGETVQSVMAAWTSNQFQYTFNGTDLEVYDTEAGRGMHAAYSHSTHTTYASLSMQSLANGQQQASAGAGQGYIFQANGDLSAAVSLPFTYSGLAITEAVGEKATVGVDFEMYVLDMDQWLTAFATAYALNGGDPNAAAEAALASVPPVAHAAFVDAPALQCSGPDCSGLVPSTTEGTLSVQFDATDGTRYLIGVMNSTNALVVSPVPLPPAVWLFGGGLLGLLGVARRRA